MDGWTCCALIVGAFVVVGIVVFFMSILAYFVL